MKGPKEVRTMESFMLKYGKAGDVFLSLLEDKNLTARAGYFGRKIKTERATILTFAGLMNPIAESITKVTIEL